jgi:hypothetical protein
MIPASNISHIMNFGSVIKIIPKYTEDTDSIRISLSDNLSTDKLYSELIEILTSYWLFTEDTQTTQIITINIIENNNIRDYELSKV